WTNPVDAMRLLTEQSQDSAASQNSPAMGLRLPRVLWIAIAVVALYQAIVVLPVVGLMFWYYADEVRDTIEWFFWGPFLISVGALLLAFSGFVWFARLRQDAERR